MKPFLFLLTLVLCGCDLIEDLIKIPIKITDEFTVPPLTGLNTVVAPVTGSTETNIEQELSVNDSRKDKIKTIKIEELRLTILDGNTDFSFIKTLEIYLVADGLDDAFLGEAENIPPSATSIDLTVSDMDFSAYLKQETVSFKTKIENKEVVLSPIDIEIFAQFRVTADIF